MNANLIEGTIRFSLLILNDDKLPEIESTLESISPDQGFFDFLPSGIVIKEFSLTQETKEVEIEIGTNANKSTS